MRKIIVHCDNSKAVGCDTHVAIVVEEYTTEEEINNLAWEISVEHISGYYDVVDNDTTEIDYEDEDSENYITTDEIDAAWEDYDPEKHDMYRPGGGSFEDDFLL